MNWQRYKTGAFKLWRKPCGSIAAVVRPNVRHGIPQGGCKAFIELANGQRLLVRPYTRPADARRGADRVLEQLNSATGA